MRYTPGDITILQIRTKNYDKMMYGSWDMVCDGWTRTDGRKKWHVDVGAQPTVIPLVSDVTDLNTAFHQLVKNWQF